MVLSEIKQAKVNTTRPVKFDDEGELHFCDESHKDDEKTDEMESSFFSSGPTSGPLSPTVAASIGMVVPCPSNSWLKDKEIQKLYGSLN